MFQEKEELNKCTCTVKGGGISDVSVEVLSDGWFSLSGAHPQGRGETFGQDNDTPPNHNGHPIITEFLGWLRFEFKIQDATFATQIQVAAGEAGGDMNVNRETEVTLGGSVNNKLSVNSLGWFRTKEGISLSGKEPNVVDGKVAWCLTKEAANWTFSGKTIVYYLRVARVHNAPDTLPDELHGEIRDNIKPCQPVGIYKFKLKMKWNQANFIDSVDLEEEK